MWSSFFQQLVRCTKSVDLEPRWPHVLSPLWLNCHRSSLLLGVATLLLEATTLSIVTMGLELFALGLVASQLAVYGLVIGEISLLCCCYPLFLNLVLVPDFWMCKRL